VAEAYIREQGATPSFLGYRGTYPATICASIDDEIVHGIPSPDRRLEEGQLLSLDFGAIWEGFHADSAVTVAVGGVMPTEDAARLVKTTEAARYAGSAAAQPGGRLSDIGHAVESVAEPAGLGIVREYGGHGIGRSMHEDPFIQNFGRAGRGPDLRPGLVIAIEPMLMLGAEQTRVLADEWTVVTVDGSLAAHFEHTVAVTEDGPEVFTARD
jgi:methionyl aminopeptidase